jgi:broad specificity phosphatase PhoE
MDLILWRHADADDGVDDMRRALTDIGRKQAKQVGKWLDAHLPDDTRILVSPATRAQETARGLGRAYETVEALAPGSRRGRCHVGQRLAGNTRARSWWSATSRPWADWRACCCSAPSRNSPSRKAAWSG